ncbi:hypothetical protein PMAYCL1PPCAC_21433, partial [Pristionchus mayeri]
MAIRFCENPRSIRKYRLGKLLGKGSYGVVLAATHEDTEEIYALKLIRVSRNDEENARKEVSRMEMLKHENIVQCKGWWFEKTSSGYQQYAASSFVLDEMDLDEDEKDKMREDIDAVLSRGTVHKLLYIKMELCSFVQERLSNNTERPIVQMIELFMQLTSAIEYLHSKKIIHRDLKPRNIVFASPDHLKVCDFGISTEIQEKGGEEVSMTRTAIGTPSYWAPEQAITLFAIRRRYASAVDIFSLGCILIEMFIYIEDKDKQMV